MASDIILEINQQVRALDLLRHLTPYPDRVAVTGDRAKCFCPIHGETVFANLFVDLKTGTFKCSMRKCAGFQGGTMVDLYVLVKGVSEAEAAIAIAELQGLEVDLEPLSQLASNGYAEALSAFESGDFATAASRLSEAENAKNPDILVVWLSLRIRLKQGAGPAIAEAAVELAQSMVAQNQTNEARTLLEEALHAHPDCFPASLALARIVASQDKRPEAIAILQETAARQLEPGGNPLLALEALQQALQWAPDDADLAKHLIESAAQAGNLELAINTCRLWADKMEAQGDFSGALEFAQDGLEIQPEETTARRRHAILLAKAGYADGALESLQALLDDPIVQADHGERRDTLEAIISLNPGHREAAWALARLYREEGRTEDSQHLLQYLSENARAVGDLDGAVGALRAMLEQDPTLADAHEQLAELYLLQEKNEEALPHLRQCAALWSSAGAPARMMDLLEKAETLSADNPDLLEFHAQLLEQSGLVDLAADRYAQLVLILAESAEANPESVLRICKNALRLRPADATLLHMKLQHLDRFEFAQEALTTLEQLWEIYDGSGEWDQALETLHEILRRDPSHRRARLRAAEMLASLGRIEEASSQFRNLWEQIRKAASRAECLQTLERWEQCFPNNLEPLHLRAEYLAQRGTPQEALEAYQVLFHRHLENNAIVEARAALEQCAALNPESLEIIRQCAALATENGTPEEARLWILRLLDLSEIQCRLDEIETDYDSALHALGYDPALRRRYAGFLAAHNLNEKALAQWQALEEQAEADPAAGEELLEIREQVVRLDPQSPHARMRLAVAMETAARFEEAAEAYHWAAALYRDAGCADEAREALFALLRLEPHNEKAREDLADLLHHGGDQAAAARQYEAIAQEMEKKGDLQRAAGSYEKALAFDQDRLDLSEHLITLYEKTGAWANALVHLRRLFRAAASQGEWINALGLAEKMEGLAPDAPDPLLMKAESFRNLKDTAKESRTIERLAGLYAARGEYKAAREQLHQLRILDPRNPAPLEQMAQLDELQGNIESALALRLEMEEMLAGAKRWEESLAILQRIKAEHPDYIAGRIRLLDRLWSQASGNAEEEALELLAYAHANSLQELAGQIAARLRESDGSAAMLRRLAEVALQCDRNDVAMQEWQRALEAARQEGDSKQMEAICLEVLAREPGSSVFRQARIEAFAMRNDRTGAAALALEWAAELADRREWAQARTLFEKALQFEPGSIEALEGRLQCIEAQGETEEARRMLESLADAFEQAGQEERSIQALERLLQLGGDPAEILPKLAVAHQSAGQDGEAAQCYLQMADLLAAQGAESAEIQALEQATRNLPQSASLYKRLVAARLKARQVKQAASDLQRLARLLDEAGDHANLGRAYEEFIAEAPDCVEASEPYAEFLERQGLEADAAGQWLRVAALHRRLGAYPQAIAAMKKAITLQDNGPAGRREYAELLQEAGEIDRALEEYGRIFAQLLEAADEPEALEICETLIRLDPAPRPWMERRMSLLEALGKDEEALAQMRRIINLAEAQGCSDEALEYLRHAVKRYPAEAGLLRHLAEMLEARDQQPEAAVQWIALGRLLDGAGQSEQAVEILQHAREISPRDEGLLLDLAGLLGKAGRTDDAAALLLEIACMAEEQERLQDAAHYLRQALAYTPDSLAAMQYLAKLMLSLQEAQAAADLFFRIADIYAHQADLPQAIHALEQARNAHPENHEAARRLISLYRAAGRWDDLALEAMQLAEMLLADRQDAEAMMLLRDLRHSHPAPQQISRMIVELIQAARGDAAAEQWLLEAAQSLARDGKQAVAVQVCREGMAIIHPALAVRLFLVESHTAWGNRAEALRELHALRGFREEAGDRAGVLWCLEKELEFDPESISTLRQVAVHLERDDPAAASKTWSKIGEIAAAREDAPLEAEALEKISELLPPEPSCLQRLASLYFRNANPEKGLEALERKAILLEELGNPEEAARTVDQMLEHAPQRADFLRKRIFLARALNDSTALLHRSRQYYFLLYERGGTEEALAVGEEICREFGDPLDVLESLTLLYLKAGQIPKGLTTGKRLVPALLRAGLLQKAQVLLVQLVQLAPRDCDLLVLSADGYELSGSREASLACLSKAMRIHQEKGERDAALSLAHRILDLQPEDAGMLAAIAGLCESANQTDAAREASRQAIRAARTTRQLQIILDLAPRLLDSEPHRLEERLAYGYALEQSGNPGAAAVQYLLLAAAYQKAGKNKEALEACQRAIALAPQNTSAHAQIALLHEHEGDSQAAAKELEWLAFDALKQDDVSRAEACIKRALALGEVASYRLHCTYGEILEKQELPAEAMEQLLLAARMALAQGNPSDALACLEKASALAPEHIGLKRQLIQLYRACGQPDEAHDESLRLGAALAGQGLLEEACAIFTALVAENPTCKQTREVIAEVYRDNGAFDMAAREYEAIAGLYEAESNHDMACEFARDALALLPDSLGAREILANAMLRMQNPEAMAEWQKLSQAYLEARRFAEAEQALRTILQFDSNCWKALSDLAALYHAMGDAEAEVQTLAQLMDLHQNLGQIDQAVEACRTLMQRMPDDRALLCRYIELCAQIGPELDLVDDHLKLARLHTEAGDFTQAELAYERVLQLAPNRDDVRQAFIQFLFDRGQADRAHAEIQAIVEALETCQEYRSAIRFLSLGLKYRLGDPSSLTKLADLYSHAGMAGTAIDICRELITLHSEKQEFDAAAETYIKCIALDPRNTAIREDALQFLLDNGFPDEARRQADLLIQEYESRNMLDLAEQVYRTLLTRDPDNTELLQAVIDAHGRYGADSEVLDDYLEMARVHEKNGSFIEAIEALLHAIHLRPDDVDLRRRHLKLALQYVPEPDLTNSFLELAQLLASKGSLDEAASLYARAMGSASENRDRMRAGASAQAASRPATSDASPATEGREQTIEALREALRRYPGHIVLQVRLAELLAKSDAAESLDLYEQACGALLSKGNIDFALSACQNALAIDPSNLRLQELLAAAQRQQEAFRSIETSGQVPFRDDSTCASQLPKTEGSVSAEARSSGEAETAGGRQRPPKGGRSGGGSKPPK